MSKKINIHPTVVAERVSIGRRHTYAVQARRDGYSDQIIAYQLGHRNTVMVQTVYGRYSPTAADYVRNQTVGPTVTPNMGSKPAKKRAAK